MFKEHIPTLATCILEELR